MDPQEVCALHRQNRFDLILLDLQMPGMDGFQVMEGLKTIEADGYLPVLVITAQPGHKLRALQAGAKDFISKPFDLVEVKTRIHNMLEVRLLHKKIENYNKALELKVQERTVELLRANEQLSQEIEERKETEESLRSANAENKELKERFQAENIYLHKDIDREYNFGEIIGRSKALGVCVFAGRAGGAPGRDRSPPWRDRHGKGVIARAIHGRSTRKDRPMITVNCSALPANLIESELFGREKGAFTGSMTGR